MIIVLFRYRFSNVHSFLWSRDRSTLSRTIVYTITQTDETRAVLELQNSYRKQYIYKSKKYLHNKGIENGVIFVPWKANCFEWTEFNPENWFELDFTFSNICSGILERKTKLLFENLLAQ